MQLTNDQITVVRATWKTMTLMGQEELGILILHKLLQDHPKLVPLFYKIVDDNEDLSEESLKKNPKVTRHAKGLVSSLDKIIESIEDQENLTTQLQRIAKIHNLHKVPSENFELMGPVLLSVVRSFFNEINEDAINAWTLAYSLIKQEVQKLMKK